MPFAYSSQSIWLLELRFLYIPIVRGFFIVWNLFVRSSKSSWLLELGFFNTCSRHTHQWQPGEATSHQVQHQSFCLPGGSTLEDLRGPAHHRVVGFLYISQPHMSCDATLRHDLVARVARLTVLIFKDVGSVMSSFIEICYTRACRKYYCLGSLYSVQD